GAGARWPQEAGSGWRRQLSAEGEENTENERPSSGLRASREFADSLSLEFLQVIKDSQQQHGLRHGDFQQYRGYCSRRQDMGNRCKFTGEKVTEDLLTDNRYLLLVLMDAERAWSCAMQLKQEANTEPRKQFHLSRLRKAVKHAEELERLCESNRVDAKTKLEAQAHTAYLSVMLYFEHQEWKAAIEAFNKCKTIYEKLASAFTEEQAVLYNQCVEESSPNIRYCAYSIGDQSAVNELMQVRLRSGGTEGPLADKLEALITQTQAKQAATMSEVEWRGRTVPVKIDKVRIFLLGLADNEAAITQAESEETRDCLFESMLSKCQDAIQAVREELKPDQKQRDYTLEYLHSYLTCIKLSTAIKWNEDMAKGLHRAQLQQQPEDDSKHPLTPWPQDLICLYDIILQNLVELLQLPGLEEDRAFQKEIGFKTLVFKVYRCFFIKCSEALVLPKDLPDMQELITQVWSEKCSLQAAAIMDANDSHQTETSSQVKDNKPLIERFETFCLDPSLVTKEASLVHFPPGFQPIPCKPLFFDLALNQVAFPPLEDKLEQKTKSGLMGYIKGIFGFRS
uniref:Signal recognition particle subunit SRP68 n=1 Tax=Jaculus jaculus TaxID=51337 RepID=A0A8C5P0R6_JACJA